MFSPTRTLKGRNSEQQVNLAGSVARAIIDYRTWRASQWDLGFVVRGQIAPSTPDVVFAVATANDELLYRTLYTAQPEDVIRLAQLIQGKHPSLVHISTPWVLQ